MSPLIVVHITPFTYVFAKIPKISASPRLGDIGLLAITLLIQIPLIGKMNIMSTIM
jgi:hypothetical protein